MAGAMGAGAGFGALGGTLGAIGDIVSAFSYQRPKLHPATGMELRLRQLAQNQLLGGGQQVLGGTALYNQMVPLLMSQLPGLHYVPGTPSTGGDMSLGGANPVGGGTSSPMQSYTSALSNLQNTYGRNQQQTALKAQIAGLPSGASPQRKQLNQQLKQLQRQIKSNPTAAQAERAAYLGGVQVDPSIYDIRMPGQGGGGGMTAGSSAGAGDQGINLGTGGGGPSLGDI